MNGRRAGRGRCVDDVLEVPAPAKLNLFLHVVGRRPDGYHEIQTVFQFVDLADRVRIARRDDNRVRRITAIPGVDEADDLAIRAARMLRDECGVEEGADIAVEKRIPLGGGLGGGSSDAASTLVGLNRLWDLGMDAGRLAELAARLGADVPVFVRGRSGWAEGVGERLHPLPLPPLWYLVVHPRVLVSTAAVFADPGLTRDSPPLKMPAPSAGRTVDVAALLAAAGNDCEPLVRLRNPVVGKVIEWLRQRVEREEWARMTGTGSAAFGVFREEGPARRAIRELPEGWDGWVTRGVAESPLCAAGQHGPASGSPAGEETG